jgi:hypothetical protein
MRTAAPKGRLLKLFDDLAAILGHVEAELDLRLTDDDLADGVDDVAHVFLHEVCHAALAHAAPWVLDLPEAQHTAVDEVAARLIEDQMATQLGLLVHTPRQHVHELSGYPVHITVEQYTHLHDVWQTQYEPGQDVAGLAKHALHCLFPETDK